MGLRGRLEEQAGRIGEQARTVAASERVRRAGESFRGFRAMIAEGGGPLSVEAYLVALVRAVRADEAEERRSSREIYVTARKRRRRLGLICFGAGPMAGVASQVADLYCEAATVSDIVDLHGLGLSDGAVAARMLVLWSLVDDLDLAEAAIRSEPPVASLLTETLAEGLVSWPGGEMTKLSIAKLLWEVHQLDLRGAVAGKGSGAQPVRSVAFTGHRTKKLIKRAEAQLGVAAEPVRARSPR